MELNECTKLVQSTISFLRYMQKRVHQTMKRIVYLIQKSPTGTLSSQQETPACTFFKIILSPGNSKTKHFSPG